MVSLYTLMPLHIRCVQNQIFSICHWIEHRTFAFPNEKHFFQYDELRHSIHITSNWCPNFLSSRSWTNPRSECFQYWPQVMSTLQNGSILLFTENLLLFAFQSLIFNADHYKILSIHCEIPSFLLQELWSLICMIFRVCSIVYDTYQQASCPLSQGSTWSYQLHQEGIRIWIWHLSSQNECVLYQDGILKSNDLPLYVQGHI